MYLSVKMYMYVCVCYAHRMNTPWARMRVRVFGGPKYAKINQINLKCKIKLKSIQF